MSLIRLGDKVISRRKIDQAIDEILRLRLSGLTQAEVANRMGVDRPLISRVECLGEIRKGSSLAVIGFPILNKDEIMTALEGEGVELILILSEKERWRYLEEKSGLTLFDTLMETIARLHSYDRVVVIGSNKRIKIIEAVLDKEVIGYEIGESPIREDKYVDPEKIIELIRAIKG